MDDARSSGFGVSVAAPSSGRFLAAEKRRRRGMSLWEAFRLALQALVSNKMRSFLTMLGIIMGVSAVIVMVALGQGAAKASEEAIRKLGTNSLYISPDSQRVRGVSQGMGTGQTMKLEDAEYLRRTCKLIRLVCPEYRNSGTVEFKTKNTQTTVYGATPEFFEINNLPMASGRSFTEDDVKRKARVAVLGDEVRLELFGDNPPVGKYIRIKGQNFRVVGVTVKRGGSSWRNRDDQVTVPVTTAMRRLYGATKLNGIRVQAVSEDKMIEAEEEVQAALKRAHKIPENEPPDTRVFNQADIMESASEQSNFLTMLLSGIALVSLIVGGIGIMNIMLVSVTERTREIGIRKAIGAKRKDILYQFLIESVTMGIAGGVIGIILGVGISLWMGMPQNEGGMGFPMLLTVPPIVLSFTFSALVGIFFGIYPALKASALDPIIALRHE